MTDSELQEQINQALSGFMGNVDIRLREKLSVLLPALDLLEKRLTSPGEADKALLEYLGEARRSAFSILRMANNMGDHARYIRNYESSEPSRINLSEMVAALMKEAALLAGYKQVSFAFECRETPFIAYVDAKQIERILYHLFSNAVLYGEGKITAELKRADGSILISVRNGGGVIGDGTFTTLYAGYREYANTKTGSLGLGLPIVLAIACQSGGTLAVTSDEKNGTTVTVSLPDVAGADEDIELENQVTARYGGFLKSLIELSDFPGYNSAYNTAYEGEEPCTTSLP